MRTAEHDWLDGQAAAQEKKSRAFRSVKFVRSETGSIDQREVDLDLAERLHHIAVQQNAALAADLRNFAHRLDHACLIVCGHN